MNRQCCSYAPPGTYGHECGKPAVYAMPTQSHTPSQPFYALRCEGHKKSREWGQIQTGEIVLFDSTVHARKFLGDEVQS